MAYTFNEFAKIREGGVDTLRLNVYEQQFNYNHLERPSIYTSLYSQVTFEFNFQLGTLDLSNKSLPDFSLVTSSKATYTDIDYFCTYDDYAMCVPWASSYTQDSTNFTILNGSLRVLGAAVPVSIPEPASFALMGVGLVALRMRRVFARQR
jgi:hypothetical protein